MMKRSALLSIMVAVIVLAVFMNLGCNDAGNSSGNGDIPGNGETPEIKNPDTFIIADTSDISSLDPAYVYDVSSAAQVQNIYETLITFDGSSTSEFIPVLATEWEISEDGLTYRFRIREGVTFHNGNPLTPEDVEYSFERGLVQDYALGPQWMFFEPMFGIGTLSSRGIDGLIPLSEIQSKIEIDGQWVVFNLSTPYEPFLQILSSSWGSVVDKDWCIEHGDWNGTAESYQELNDPLPGSSPITSIANGTGPFSLEWWEPGIEISLIRNDNYWGEPASFERVITKIVPEWSLRKLMIEQGDADTIMVPTSLVSEFEGIDGVQIYDDLPLLLNQALFFQFAINGASPFVGSGILDGNGIPLDFFSDLDVRKGFAYAFDWEMYLEDGLLGYGQKIASPIVEGLPYYNPDIPMYSFDPSKAEEHLRAAWDGEVWEKGFKLTVVYSLGDMAGKIAAEILQNNLFEINPNFKINIQLMSWSSILTEIVLGKLPMYLNGWTADYPDPHNFIFPYMHSLGTFSGSQGYHNQEVDALITQAITSSESAERQMVYDQLATIYYQEVPSVMLSQMIGPYVFRDWIKGFVFNPIKLHQAMYAYELSKG